VQFHRKHTTAETGASYARTDNVTWSYLAFLAIDETQLAIAKFKTRTFVDSTFSMT